MSGGQYSFAPYQDPPEDIPAHEREQAAFTSSSHYSSEDPATSGQGEQFLASGGVNGPDDRINQYETSLPIRCVHYEISLIHSLDWISKLLLLTHFLR